MSKADETFVLICSKQGDNPLDDRNPFSYEERRNMIELSIGKNKVHFRHIEDQESDECWTNIINKEMPKGRKVSFTNNPNTKTAFKSHGYEVLPIPIKHNNLNATLIRKKIIRGEPWAQYVPNSTWCVINDIRGDI